VTAPHDFIVERVNWGEPGYAHARRAEFEIFGIPNRFATPDDIAAGEMLTYRQFERTSEFYLARMAENIGGDIIGVVRLIRHDPALGVASFSTVRDARSYAPPGGGSPTCHSAADWAVFFDQIEPYKIAELATQAILPAYRRRGAIEELWRPIIDICRSEGVEYWTVALTVPLFRWYSMMFPNALKPIGRTMLGYVGADSVPGILSINHPDLEAYRQRSSRFIAANARLRADIHASGRPT
jgi:hypothetical protein